MGLRGMRILFTATSSGALAMSGVAFAQEGASGQEESSEPRENNIVVTAQFREQRLQDTPIAITAISGETIERKALSDVAEISSTVPNVLITESSASFAGATVFIRGVGQPDSNFALEPGVGMYVDDIYHGVMVGSLFDLLDLERVEILRGPQGTLAGKNSIGGAVKLFSRKPEGDGSGYLSATYGSLDRIDVRGAYDIGLSDDVFLRVSVFSKRRDGHVKILDFACDRPEDVEAGDPPTRATGDGCQTGSLGGTKASGLRAALRFVPSSDVEINLFGTIIRDDSEPVGIEQTATPDTRFLPDRPYTFYGTYTTMLGYSVDPVAKTHSESIGGQIDWDFSDSLQLTSITSYENIDAVWTQDRDGGPLGQFLTYNFSPYHQFTQELRLNGEFGGDLVEWTLGGYYFDSKGYVGARTFTQPSRQWIQNDPVSNKSTSAFAHVIVHPVSHLSLIGGIRYTDDRKTYRFSRLDPNTGLPAEVVGSLEGVSETYEGDSWDYRLGVDYRFNDALMAYANFSTGYKGGGINPRPFIPIQVVPFDPERVNAFEVGFKSDLAGGAVRLNAAAFLNKYRDIILLDKNGYPGDPTDPNWFPLSAVPFNAGDADVKGFELETTIEPILGLTLDGSLSYLDFQYTSLDPNAIASGVTMDSKSPFSPEWKWSLQAAYEVALPSGATITPQVSVDYLDDFFVDVDNPMSGFVESRTVVDANITYRTPSENWSFIVGVSNLTDKHYYTNVFDLVAIEGSASKVVARPREFFVTARRDF